MAALTYFCSLISGGDPSARSAQDCIATQPSLFTLIPNITNLQERMKHITRFLALLLVMMVGVSTAAAAQEADVV